MRFAVPAASGALLLAVLPIAAAAQSVRGTATTTARLVEFRPLRVDTLAVGDPGRPDIGCRPGIPCFVYRPDTREQAIALSQDVRLTAWGFGVAGLSATAYVRVRQEAGDVLWPRADDTFDALVAYAEYDRSPVRVRVGRQYATGGLGFSSFDGASVLVRAGPALSAEVYGGRSLARGLSEPRSEAIQGFEDLVPDPSVYLIGADATGRIASIAVGARYQREIFADRSALASERASIDGTFVTGPVRLTGSADYDLAFGRFGKADLRARAGLGAGVAIEAVGRRYVPYFELWTIWGFFDPVAWDEGEMMLSWTREHFGLLAAGAIRRYEETGVNVLGPELPRDARRLRAGGWWRPAAAIWIDAAWRYETGFGSLSGGIDATVRWQASERLSVRVSGTRFDQIEEFRLGQGTVLGGSMSARLALTGRLDFEGGASLYDQTSTRPDTPDWTQRRLWTSLRIEFGRDPGRIARPLR